MPRPRQYEHDRCWLPVAGHPVTFDPSRPEVRKGHKAELPLPMTFDLGKVTDCRGLTPRDQAPIETVCLGGLPKGGVPIWAPPLPKGRGGMANDTPAPPKDKQLTRRAAGKHERGENIEYIKLKH